MSPIYEAASSALQWLPPVAALLFLTAIVFGLI